MGLQMSVPVGTCPRPLQTRPSWGQTLSTQWGPRCLWASGSPGRGGLPVLASGRAGRGREDSSVRPRSLVDWGAADVRGERMDEEEEGTGAQLGDLSTIPRQVGGNTGLEPGF